MNIKEKIGQRIKASRKEIGLTIRELAEQTNELTAARIGNWEQGTRSPGPSEALILANHLKVSASYLLCLTDSPQGELTHHTQFGMRRIPVLAMNEVLHYKEILNDADLSSEKTIVVDGFNRCLLNENLFAVIAEDRSMEPQIKEGSVVIVNGEQLPKPGDNVLAHINSKTQTVIRKYGELEDGQFNLIANNDLWANIAVKSNDEIRIVGTISEIRCYY